MIHLYDNLDSGNGYKVRLILRLTQRPFSWTNLDIVHGATRTPEFLAKNPNGRIPTVRLDDGNYLAESNAILWFLAEGTPFIPHTPLGRAQALQWMFFEQYSHEPYVATPRFIVRHTAPDSPRRAEMPGRLEAGRAALSVMDLHLTRHSYFVDDRYSVADVALYAYTHVAEEGGHDLRPFPAIHAWLERVARQPGHVPITWTPSGQ